MRASRRAGMRNAHGESAQYGQAGRVTTNLSAIRRALPAGFGSATDYRDRWEHRDWRHGRIVVETRRNRFGERVIERRRTPIVAILIGPPGRDSMVRLDPAPAFP